tara:strand:+ start:3236 stop:3370 length:135 start_codon:yes stop_codon:yes gene_type:complete
MSRVEISSTMHEIAILVANGVTLKITELTKTFSIPIEKYHSGKP